MDDGLFGACCRWIMHGGYMNYLAFSGFMHCFMDTYIFFIRMNIFSIWIMDTCIMDYGLWTHVLCIMDALLYVCTSQ